MNWTSIRSTLLAVVQDIDGITDASAVAWSDSKEGAYHAKFPRVRLSVTSVIGYGDDESRVEADELGDRTEYISGPRRFTLSVRVEADQGGQAVTIADRIRARLGRQDAYATLLAAELAVADIEATQIVPYKADGRSYQVAVMDVFVNCAENDTDDSEYAGEPIEQVSIASEHLNDPNGEHNPNQIDLEVSENGY